MDCACVPSQQILTWQPFPGDSHNLLVSLNQPKEGSHASRCLPCPITHGNDMQLTYLFGCLGTLPGYRKEVCMHIDTVYHATPTSQGDQMSLPDGSQFLSRLSWMILPLPGCNTTNCAMLALLPSSQGHLALQYFRPSGLRRPTVMPTCLLVVDRLWPPALAPSP